MKNRAAVAYLPLQQNNKIVVKLNYSSSAEKIRKQTQENFANRIDIYPIENNTHTIKLLTSFTLPSKYMVKKRKNEKKIE